MFDAIARNSDERAVSPVIGVILMVAITVILAAVVGTFVLNMAGSIETNVQAGAAVSADDAANEVTVTWTSNQNADYLILSVGTNSSANWADDGRLDSVGDTDTYSVSSGSNEYRVVVTAHRGDQATAIITEEVTA